ncbi:MAG: alpha-hydroxy-acid oxidizing protein [Paucimonas sp.]|nr:alpha-hydroxy-acid oxidizing protein [Paucimonas sp.]
MAAPAQVSPSKQTYLRTLLSAADLERAARRRLPPSVFGYVAGGSGDENALRGNRSAFDRWTFIPHALVDVSRRSQSMELFGTTYAAPAGIGPMGATNICRYDGDCALARAARRVGVPFILSGASTTPLETVARENPDMWFQAYIPSRREVIKPLMERVAAAGVKTLVVTVDMPFSSQREMELRNGFSLPFRLSGRLMLGGLSRPRWMVETFARTLINQGIPHFENFTATRGVSIIAAGAGNHRAGRDALSWDDMLWIRDNWDGNLVIKGILRTSDALKAQSIGANGIIVSNHGGRQLDGAIAPLDALPGIVAAVSGMSVMVDSGFRRGTDVLKALALGANFVFVGRPVMYGLAIAGEEGAVHALKLLQAEIDHNLALLGCPDLSHLSKDLLCPRNA